MKRFLNGVALAAMLLGCAHMVLAQLGGYKKVATDEADVVEAANFAVGEANKKEEGTEVKLSSIQSAEKQAVAGTNYRLCLKVEINGEDDEVKVVVFRSLQKEWSLESWTQESCGGDQ